MPGPDTTQRLRMAARAAAAVVLVFAAIAPVSATTLVVLVSKRAIVIGADSMRTLAGGGTRLGVQDPQHRRTSSSASPARSARSASTR